MAMGPKRNEGGTVIGVRPGNRSSAKYVRVSAYKAREVLNLIRGLDVKRADEVLQFTERSVAADVRKVLASAVANAVHNDQQDADELFVLACFADEGPTLKRFQPRARGRAARIRKRTCHITVVVDRMSDEALARKAAKESAQGGARSNRAARVAASSGAAARRDRVAASRAKAADKSAATDTAAETSADESTADEAIVDQIAANDEATASEVQGLVDSDAMAGLADDAETAPYGVGSHIPLDNGGQPEGYDIKGNADSMLYHVPGSSHYDRTIAEVWFATEAAAEAAGFSKPKSQQNADDKNDGEDA